MEDKKAFACANYILDKLQSHKINDVTNLKLQKLLYFAYGIYKVLYDDSLFDDKIQAWTLGPVVPSVYHEFKDHGKNPITTRAYFLQDDYSGEVMLAKYDDFSENMIKSISIACAAYGHKTAWTLVDITHKDNSAWAKVYRKDKKGEHITDDAIKNEFNQYLDTLAIYLLG
jgi:uncharacterized phage-associated protein